MHNATMVAPVRTLHSAVMALPDSKARSLWIDTLESLPTEPNGTLRRWAKDRHGATVRTYQWRITSEGKPVQPWSPGPRVLDSRTRASAMILDGSFRDYDGCRVVAASDGAILIESTFGADMQYCAYVVESA